MEESPPVSRGDAYGFETGCENIWETYENLNLQGTEGSQILSWELNRRIIFNRAYLGWKMLVIFEANPVSIMFPSVFQPWFYWHMKTPFKSKKSYVE